MRGRGRAGRVTEGVALWWLLHWARKHPTRTIPYAFWLLWHCHNASHLAASKLSTDPYPEPE